MLSRYWGALLAAIGLTITAFGSGGYLVAVSSPTIQPSPEHHSKEGDAGREPSAGNPTVLRSLSQAPQVVEKSILTNPCEPTEDDRNSDLCAQWKAADAARDSAWWAMVGTVVAALATIAIFYQIKLTREAVQDTGKATRAMERQNDLAERLQRPWVTAEIHPIYIGNFGERLAVEVKGEFTNVGQSAAVSTVTCVDIIYVNEDFAVQLGNWIKDIEKNIGEVGRKILPGETIVRQLNRVDVQNSVQSTYDDERECEIIFIVAVAAIFYKRSEGDDVWLKTIRPFMIQKRAKTKGRDDMGFIMSGFNFSDDNLTADLLTAESIVGEITT